MTYRDNYPHNIEAPQKVYVQYSQDIDFDYSNGKYPLGEDYEGFIWENVYIPYPHTLGDLELRKHVWMRWRVGDKDNWTLPMRFTDTFLNIEATEAEEIVGTDKVQFRLKFTLESGEVIYSEYIVLTNGIDGRGIESSEIRGDNLFLLYTDGTEENVGRVVGYNGVGFGSVGSEIPGNLPWVDENGNVVWININELLALTVTGVDPITFDGTNIGHNNADGFRHIPTGGALGEVLSTDGSGNYSWIDPETTLGDYIPWTALDDNAGVGDTASLYSADKILSLIGSLSAFGIKYSVALFTDLAAIPTPASGELAVVTSDPLYPNRPVYQYDGATWISFFDLDADHNHDDRYFTQTQLSTSGQSTVHWDNLTNVPASINDGWNISDTVTSLEVNGGDTINIVGGSGATVSLSGDTLTISATGTTLNAGNGIDITGNVISHFDTSSIADSTNLDGAVIQNLTFDGFGHVQSHSSINLDTRYYTQNYINTNYYTQSYVDNNFVINTGPNPTNTEIIPIGVWDMNSSTIHNVSWSIPINTEIIHYSCVIYDDSFGQTYPISYVDLSTPTNPIQSGGIEYDPILTNFVLKRTEGGVFDSTSYGGGSNRGYIYIIYQNT